MSWSLRHLSKRPGQLQMLKDIKLQQSQMLSSLDVPWAKHCFCPTQKGQKRVSALNLRERRGNVEETLMKVARATEWSRISHSYAMLRYTSLHYASPMWACSLSCGMSRLRLKSTTDLLGILAIRGNRFGTDLGMNVIKWYHRCNERCCRIEGFCEMFSSISFWEEIWAVKVVCCSMLTKHWCYEIYCDSISKLIIPYYLN